MFESNLSDITPVKREEGLNDDFMRADGRDANNNVFGNNDPRVSNYNSFTNTQANNNLNSKTHFSSAPVQGDFEKMSRKSLKMAKNG